MATQLTKEQFIAILLDKTLTKTEDVSVFQAMFSFENHKARASQIGRLLGSKAKTPGSPINLQIGRLAKRIAKKYDLVFTKRDNERNKSWDIFFDGSEDGSFWVWQLKRNLIDALVECNLTGEIQYPDEIPVEYENTLFEGAKRTIIVNSYERNSEARRICISHWGTVCTICRFDFEKEYGELGKGFIHVHHLKPVSEIGYTYEVDPIKDLRPVCPNCHSMLHRQKKVLGINELKNILKVKEHFRKLPPTVRTITESPS
jgi:5-methylcytosine-specific restriction protein A